MNTYLFFDDFIIDNYQSIKKRHFKAKKCSTFYKEKITGGHTVFKTNEGYTLIYTIISDYSKDWDRTPFYATSEDGINYKHAGRLTGMDVPGMFYVNYDPHTKNENEKYKTVIMKVDEKESANAKGYVSTSKDGFIWNTNTDYKISDHASDTTNNIFYNPIIKKYQLICRGAHVDRRISTMVSNDLKTWSDPMLILAPTPFDEPFTQYYGLTVYPLNGIFLGALQIYHTDPNDFISNKMVGKTDASLVYSYNGISWSKVSNDYMIERMVSPEFGSAGIYPSNMVESKDGKEWIIGAGSVRTDHGCGFYPAYPNWHTPTYAKENGKTAVCFYKIRKHGFTGLESVGYNSYIRFKKMRLTGNNLTFNGISICGYFKFQIKDENYNIIKGFSFDDCIPFVGDSVAFTPEFKNNKIGNLIGKSIHIEIECRGATLYAMEGDLKPHHGVQLQDTLGTPYPTKE